MFKLPTITLILVCDQLSKFFADSYLVLHQPLVIFEYFNLTLVYNRGAAFGFLSEAGDWNRWFFIILTVCVISFLLYLLKGLGRGKKPASLAIALIVGGALGNLADRILWGHVIDFIDVHYMGYHWPAFNVADSAITIGALLLIILLFGEQKDKSFTR